MTATHPPANPADSVDAVDAVSQDELFLRNMRSLWRNDPSLAMRVDAVDDEDRLPVTRTKSGAWTVRVPAPSGTGAGAGATVLLHSRYDPVAEAKRFIESVPLEDKYCLFVAGLGLGYHVKVLLDRLRGDAFVVCGEPSIPMIATALTCVDLSEPIALGRLVFLTDGDKSRLHERMKDRNTLMMLGAQFVQHPPSMRVAENEHKAILEAMKDFASYSRMTLVTLLSNSRITCENIAMNLARYVSTPSIDLLRDRFKGDPAIVISAGPSLSRNIDQLAALKGRAVLCAVQTTLRPLLERGIVPDFATSLDFHEMSTKFFEGVGDLSQTHLVAEPKATWPVIDNYPGPVSLLESPWAKLLIGDELAGRGSLQAGATVAHLAFYLAVYMGCDPIIFVGQDLAFTGHVFYVPGVEIHRAWRGELNRFNTMEHKEWDRIVRNRPILRRITGVDGEPMYTDELLLTYLEQFEKDVAAVPNRVVNATEGGARINGTESMTLADAVDRFCGHEIDPERFAYRSATSWHDAARLAPTRDELQRRIAELDDVVAVCDELLTLLRELDGITDDPSRFNKRLVRVDELRTKISDQSRAYLVVNAFTQLAELRRYSADRRIKAVETDDAERAKAQIARDIEFITGVREGAVELKPMLVRANERVVEAIPST